MSMTSLSSRTKTLKKGETLSLLAGINRPVNPSQVTKLAKSLDKMGLIRAIVVAKISFLTGKLTSYIIDGQHLFHALLRNGVEIEYVEIEVKDKKDLVEKIALLNSSSKSWTLIDYVTAWASIVPDFQKLLYYYNTYDFELGILTSILAKRSLNIAGGGTTNSKIIKDGSFRIQEEVKAVSILDNLTDILKVIPRMNRSENKYVCSEYVNFRRVVSNYDHIKFMTNLEANRKKFVFATQEPQKLTEMFKLLAV